MIKKAKKLWSKKLKAAIISLSLGLAIALGGAVAAISISANKNNLGGTLADGAASENVSYTFKKGGNAPVGGTKYQTMEQVWDAAIKYSIANNVKVAVDLTEDWIATDNSDKSNTSFGSSTLNDGTEPFYYGQINVPVGADVVLNMGTYKIDRNLINNEKVIAAGGVRFGGVLYVYGGKLSVNGTVTKFDDSAAARDDGGYGYNVSGLVMEGAIFTGGYTWTEATEYTSGSVYIRSNGEANFTNIGIFNNRAHITKNYAHRTGGGLALSDGAIVNFKNGYSCGNVTDGFKRRRWNYYAG